MNSGGKTGCSTGDCEGEEQEDPSSSKFDDEADGLESGAACFDSKDQVNSAGEGLFAFREELQKELEGAACSKEDKKKPEQDDPPTNEEETNPQESDDTAGDELAVFRQQWQRELEPTPAPDGPADTPPAAEPPPAQQEEPSIMEKAKIYFLKGTALERSGQWYDAVQHYKRAMALVPNIEWQLYEASKGTETPEEESEAVVEAPVNTNMGEDSDEEMVEGEEVVTRLLRIQARRGLRITPQHDARSTHISALPYEVLLVLLRWVVSSGLDCMSLEAVGATCRALHVAARDNNLWRAVCLRTWGVECGSPRALGFASWRAMYLLRPRLQLNGCYISKTTYLRHGENIFQDHFYRPWYLIDYYRYVRFFPDGQALSWTSPDEPAACVREMRLPVARPGLGILVGHYRLIGNKVVIVTKRSNERDRKQPQSSNTRFRARRIEPEPEPEQTYHMELELRSVKKGRRNNVLYWTRYRVARRDNWTAFDLTPRAFPPFFFSRVKAYTREASASL